MTTIEIKGPGMTIQFPTEIIIKALKDAGLQVDVEDQFPSDNVDELISEMKNKINSGEIKDWKINVKTKHLPWGG